MNKTGTGAPSRLHLWQKLLLPFLLVLVVVGSTVTAGTIYFVSNRLAQSVEQRLETLQEVVYREIKEQEILLLTYASMLEYLQATSGTGATARILEDQVYASLRESRVSVAYYSPAIRKSIPFASLSSLLDQAHRSGRPRLRVTTDLGAAPALTVAAPTSLHGDSQDIIVLQIPLSHHFLRKLSAGFNANTSLLTLDGALLVTAEERAPPPELTPQELQEVVSGRPQFKTTGGIMPHKYLFQAVPLGTTDLVIAVTDAPMTEIGQIIHTLTWRSLLTFLIVFLIGGYVYYRVVRQVTAPAEELLHATEEVSQGNLDYRIERIAGNDLGRLATSFNEMLGRLKAIHEENLAREKALTLAQEEIRYKEVLEEKNREIETRNQELRDHLAEMSALFQLNQAMISTLDINLLFDRMVEVLQNVLNCQGIGLLLYHPGAIDLELRRSMGIGEEFMSKGDFRLNGGFAGLAAQTQEMIYLPDLDMDHPALAYQGGTLPEGSLVCAPMVVKKRLAGLLLLVKHQANAFSEVDLKLAQAVANQAAMAIENARLYESTRTLSNIDELTRLANRRYFQEILKREVGQAQRYGSNFSLVMIDIDHFKRYNDIHGHLCGDTALKMVADILLQNTRGIDLVARFGGEEFVILLPKTEKRGAEAAADKLCQRIAETTFPGARKSQPGGILTISLGISTFPMDGKDMFELLDCADRALYRAKAEGRNRVVTWQGTAPPTAPAIS